MPTKCLPSTELLCVFQVLNPKVKRSPKKWLCLQFKRKIKTSTLLLEFCPASMSTGEKYLKLVIVQKRFFYCCSRSCQAFSKRKIKPKNIFNKGTWKLTPYPLVNNLLQRPCSCLLIDTLYPECSSLWKYPVRQDLPTSGRILKDSLYSPGFTKQR